VPILAVFDVNSITLSGAVPSEAARERLKFLAAANAKTPATVVDLLTIDPTVPISMPVRVVELTSARFPEGSAEVLPAHAAELDRVVGVLNALPNVTALVIGHADQIGDPANNQRLSEQRAQAVVAYMASRGIDGSRLSSRAVGESDLLTLADDAAALALNRRTEFVFSGLLVSA
jgi:outer membrane protein OmpA-like peptidoglycan-associated protein